MNAYYGRLCTEIYDATKPIGGEYPDVPYYLRQLQGIRGPILEAMSGTGRLLIPLLEAGLRAEGLDNSAEMLALCRRHCIARKLDPVLHHLNLQELATAEHFEAILVSFGSFGLIDDRHAATAVLAGFHAALKAGGRLFIDLVPGRPDKSLDGVVKLSRQVELPDGSVITMQESRRHLFVDQVSVTSLKYEKWKDERLIDTELQHFPLRWYGRWEFESFLREAGFADVTVCADFQENKPPDEQSERLCYSAVKP